MPAESSSSDQTEPVGLIEKMVDAAKGHRHFGSSMKLTDYFQLADDGSLITWSHAVNSQAKLDETLKGRL